MWRIVACVVMVLGWACSGCAAGVAAEAVAPEQVSARHAMSESEAPACDEVPAYGEPLVVDWTSKQRLDLELAMRGGVAVVAYTCKRFELLKRCQVSGSYAFAGVSRKEDVIQLENSDEIKANLPLQAIKAGAELARDATIDLALVRIGKRTTTRSGVAKPDLEGACEGATHFVRAATVGAFAMKRGTKGKIEAAAEMFGATLGGKTSSEKQVSNKDGDIDACRRSKASASAPPDQCQAALRLELEPIAAYRAAKKAEQEGPKKPSGDHHEDDARAGARCPPGLVATGGKCAKPDDDSAFVCEEDDAEACRTQCDRGSGESCQRLAILHQRGVVVKRDEDAAITYFRKACERGHANSCRSAGSLVSWRCDRQRRKAKKGPEACDEAQAEYAKLAAKACDAGSERACFSLASYPDLLKRSGRDANALRERACSLGHTYACSRLGKRLIDGKDVKKDVARGMRVLQRSCEGGQQYDCIFLAKIYLEGKVVPRHPRLRLKALDRACSLGSPEACLDAGRMHRYGAIGVPKDEDKAIARWREGCRHKFAAAKSCQALAGALRGRAWRVAHGTKKLVELRRQVLRAYTRACVQGGLSCEQASDLARRSIAGSLRRACDKGSASACEKFALHMTVQGCARNDDRSCKALAQEDPERAKTQARRLCTVWGGNPKAKPCIRLVELGGKLPERPKPPPRAKRPRPRKPAKPRPSKRR